MVSRSGDSNGRCTASRELVLTTVQSGYACFATRQASQTLHEVSSAGQLRHQPRADYPAVRAQSQIIGSAHPALLYRPCMLTLPRCQKHNPAHYASPTSAHQPPHPCMRFYMRF